MDTLLTTVLSRASSRILGNLVYDYFLKPETNKVNELIETQKIARDAKATELCNRADGLRELGKYQEAIENYDKVIQIYPNQAYYWYNRGLCLLKLNQYEEGIKSLKKAVEVSDEKQITFGALCSLGSAYFSLKKYEEAIDTLTQALEIDSNLNYGWIVLIESYLNSKPDLLDLQKPLKYCEKLKNDSNAKISQAATNLKVQILHQLISKNDTDKIQIFYLQSIYSQIFLGTLLYLLLSLIFNQLSINELHFMGVKIKFLLFSIVMGLQQSTLINITINENLAILSDSFFKGEIKNFYLKRTPIQYILSSLALVTITTISLLFSLIIAEQLSLITNVFLSTAIGIFTYLLITATLGWLLFKPLKKYALIKSLD